MDEFKLKKGMLVSRSVQIGYPLVALGGIIALMVLVDMRLTEAGPLIIVGLLGWLGYEIWRTYGHFTYRICVDDQQIDVNGKAYPWSQISKARINSIRFGMDPLIILITQDGGKVKIPAAIDGLNYIEGFVVKHVGHIEREES